jgi:DNA-binding NarL/FixJ family response regulator
VRPAVWRELPAPLHAGQRRPAQEDHRTSQRRRNPPKRGTDRKLSSEEVVVLVERYRAGATMIELAEQFKIHRTTVSAHLRPGW